MEEQLLQPAKKTSIKIDQAILILSSLLILMWVFTIGSKLMTFTKFQMQLLAQPLPLWLNKMLVYVLIPVELLNVPLLYFTKTRIYGFSLSLLMMLSFTVYIAWMLVFHENLPCACGGPIPKWGWDKHLLFNIFFTLLSATGLLLTKTNRCEAIQLRSRLTNK